MKRLLVLFSILVLAATASAAVETYTIDPAHSSIGFSITHIISKVPGTFAKFSGTIKVDRDDLTKSTVDATIDATSINTANAKRDGHLQTPDFFDTAKFPTATFKSKSWTKADDDSTFNVLGDLTIKGTTREVTLKVKLLGFAPGMKEGTQLSGWEASTTLSKSDFGVNGPAMLAKMLGNEVDVHINVEADLQK